MNRRTLKIEKLLSSSPSRTSALNIEDHPHPQSNGLYGVKVGVRMPQNSESVCHKSRFVHHILCESAFISRDFYAMRPLSLWHILGSYSLLIRGGGVVEIVFRIRPEDILISRTHPSDLRWAKSRDIYRRIASESYRCDSNR